jgi:hypothetical protein
MMNTGNKHDAFYYYEEGLNLLKEKIDKKHDYYKDFLIYEQQLFENITDVRRTGDNDTRRSRRAEIIEQLNHLALKVLGKSFNELFIPPSDKVDKLSLSREANESTYARQLSGDFDTLHSPTQQLYSNDSGSDLLDPLIPVKIESQDRDELEAIQFYSKYKENQKFVPCILTGESDAVWYHLDGNNNMEAHTFDNIIPISRNLLVKVRNDDYVPTDFRRTPECLQPIAKIHYRLGNFAQGYACSRLGAFLTGTLHPELEIKSINPELAIDFCSDALINLRSISQVPLAIDTLYNALPIFQTDN